MNNPDRTAQREPRFIALLDLPTPSLPISQRFARRLRYERRVSSYKLGGRVYFAEADLRDFIDAGRTEAR
jgi:hypothetical protein